MKSESIQLAQRFAHSLDTEDYATTAECLAPDCQYEVRGKVHRGRDAILASYRKSGDWAARTLDGIRYESTVRIGQKGEVLVEFVDNLEHAGLTLKHRCEQRLEFDQSGLISIITHVDFPGEQDALDRFFKSVGLSARHVCTSEVPKSRRS